MPKRTELEKRAIAALEEKLPDKFCNARIPTNDEGARYCRNLAGFKTDHLGSGRCYLHGGASGGRPIIHGLFSKKLTSTLQVEYDKLVKDPALIDLYAEMALTKLFVGQLLSALRTKMLSEFSELDEKEIEEMTDEDVIKSGNWMVQYSTKSGAYTASAELNAFIKVVDMSRKIYKDIVDTETKSMNTLNIKQVYSIINQIKNQMMETCGMCPVRNEIVNRLARTKIMNLDKQQD